MPDAAHLDRLGEPLHHLALAQRAKQLQVDDDAPAGRVVDAACVEDVSCTCRGRVEDVSCTRRLSRSVVVVSLDSSTVTGHAPWLVEGAHQVLAARHVDGRLAADGRVEHRHHRGRHLHHRHAAHVRRRDIPSQVADHSAYRKLPRRFRGASGSVPSQVPEATGRGGGAERLAAAQGPVRECEVVAGAGEAWAELAAIAPPRATMHVSRWQRCSSIWSSICCLYMRHLPQDAGGQCESMRTATRRTRQRRERRRRTWSSLPA